MPLSWNALNDGLPTVPPFSSMLPNWGLFGSYIENTVLYGGQLEYLEAGNYESIDFSFEIEFLPVASTGYVFISVPSLIVEGNVAENMVILLVWSGDGTVKLTPDLVNILGSWPLPTGKVQVTMSMDVGGNYEVDVDGTTVSGVVSATEYGEFPPPDPGGSGVGFTDYGVADPETSEFVSGTFRLYSMSVKESGGYETLLSWDASVDGVPDSPPWTVATPSAWSLSGDRATVVTGSSMHYNTDSGEWLQKVRVEFKADRPDASPYYVLGPAIYLGETLSPTEDIVCAVAFQAHPSGAFQLFDGVSATVLAHEPSPTWPVEVTLDIDYAAQSWEVSGSLSGSGSGLAVLGPLDGSSLRGAVWNYDPTGLNAGEDWYYVRVLVEGDPVPVPTTAFLALDVPLTLDDVVIFDRALSVNEVGRLNGS